MVRRQLGPRVDFSGDSIRVCPCGSGKAPLGCCLKSTGFRKRPAKTRPAVPRTGRSHAQCYAAALKDCSQGISREHFVSDSLLKHIAGADTLTVAGFPWISEGGTRVLTPSSLASKMLCGRHNSALSELDAQAIRFFKAFDDLHLWGHLNEDVMLFNGHDLERWFLKILCGLAGSGNLEKVGKLDISSEWLEILFGYRDFGPGLGLYIPSRVGRESKPNFNIEMAPLSHYGVVSGLLVHLCGYELILCMRPLSGRVFLGEPVIYRPMELLVKNAVRERSVVFSWDGAADLGTITVTIRRPQAGAAQTNR